MVSEIQIQQWGGDGGLLLLFLWVFEVGEKPHKSVAHLVYRSNVAWLNTNNYYARSYEIDIRYNAIPLQIQVKHSFTHFAFSILLIIPVLQCTEFPKNHDWMGLMISPKLLVRL